MVDVTKPIAPPTQASAKPSAEIKKPDDKAKESPKQPDGPRFAYSLKIKVGDLEFHNLKGDFLAMPLIDLSTNQVGKVDFLINERSSDRNQLPVPPVTPPTLDPKAAIADSKSAAKVEEKKADPNSPVKKADVSAAVKLPTDPVKVDGKASKGIDPKDLLKAEAKAEQQKDDPESLWGKLKAQESAECQIELGFPGFLFNKLVGKLWRIGRTMPDGICLEIVDMSAAAQSTNPSVAQSTDPNLAPTPKEEPKLGSDGKPIAILGPDGKPLKPAILLGADGKPIASPSIPGKADATKTPQKALADAANSNSKIAPTPNAAIVAKDSGLKFELKSDAATGAKGTVATNTPAIKAVGTEAAKVGDAIVVDGNTIKQVSPGAGTPTGLILDWNQHKSIFIRKPTISKKTPNHLQGAGAIGVQGWDVNGKQVQQGFAVTPGAFTPVPGGVINVPEWGALKMSDPIFPGCLYTWGDATKGGNRKPQGKIVMQGIVEIAQKLMELHSTQAMNGGKKVEVTSWYRDPATNVAMSSSGANGPHTHGCAVDFWFEGYIQFYKKIEPTWKGGLAFAADSRTFIHIDLGGVSPTFQTTPGRRWPY